MQPLIPYFEPLEIPIYEGIAIHGFGVLVALGIILGARLAQWKAEKDGNDPELINRFVGWVVVGIFVGGHLGHALFYEPHKIAEDPLYLLRVWDGLSSYGGFTACIILGLIFYKREDNRIRDENKQRIKDGKPRIPRISNYAQGDALMMGLTLGWMFGRFGCFSAHDHPGVQTDFWLGVKGMVNPNTLEAGARADWIQRNLDAFPALGELAANQRIPGEIWQQVAYHDMGLYEALLSGAMCLLFLWLDRKPRFTGFFLGLFVAIYGPARFVMDFFRIAEVDEGARSWMVLTPAQWGSLALGAIGFWILWTRRNTTPQRIQNKEYIEARDKEKAAAASS